jgi:hypothetical protein
MSLVVGILIIATGLAFVMIHGIKGIIKFFFFLPMLLLFGLIIHSWKIAIPVLFIVMIAHSFMGSKSSDDKRPGLPEHTL